MAEQPIIIKRVKKGGHGGHHGGAWKVAYADFVTAMMAFFLLLWLLNAVTQEQLKGISDYFAPAALSKSNSGAGGMLGGKTIGEGAMTSQNSSPTVSQSIPPPTIGDSEDLVEPEEGLTEDQFKKLMAEREEQQFQKAQESLQQAMKSIPELQKFQNSLMVDNTPEGLRIQLVDQEGLAMFPSGSPAMYGHTRSLLDVVARVILQMPQKVSISGHTDAVPFRSEGRTNWELSAERALESRRVLMGSGVPDSRVDRVVGHADQDLLLKDDPTSPRNRRISIVLLRENQLNPSQPQPQAQIQPTQSAMPASAPRPKP